jgi:hypothetical protein
MSGCKKCSYGDPMGEAHYHIVVEHGRVIQVDYLSADGYWDRELEKDEYFVEYRTNPKKFWTFKTWQWTWPSFRKPRRGNPASEDWVKPKLYKGDPDEEAEDLS